MDSQNTKFKSIILWLLPSGTGFVIYLSLCGLTLATSNATFFRNLFYIPQNFQLQSAVLDSIGNLVEHLVGDQIARSAVVAIFWAVVGLFVYVLIWMLMNYSDDLGSDLAATKYMHPRNFNTKSALHEFISRSLFKIVVFFILVFYINFTIGVFTPHIGHLYRVAIQQWPQFMSIVNAFVGICIQFFMIHFMVVLARLLTLRRRIFG